MLKVIPYILTNNRCYKNGKTRTPIGIQIHTIGTAQGTAKAVADYWNQSSVDACVTYICDADEPGRVYQTLPENYFTWGDGGYGNRNLITIEIAESDFMKYKNGTAEYVVTNEKLFAADVLRGYDTAVELCIDICKRYKWDPMAKLPSGLFLISSHNEGRLAGLSYPHVDPSHLWPRIGLSMDTFRQAVKNGLESGLVMDGTEAKYYRVRKTWKDASSQLGAYESLKYAKAACPYLYTVFDHAGKAVYKNKTKPVGTQATIFKNMNESDAAEKLIDIIHECDKSGILNSITAAQAILESGYGKTTLATSANNLFGMKSNLSGGTWESVWDGKSEIDILTWEHLDGKDIQIHDRFRKYKCIEDSIKDHALYILGSMDGKKKRYDGILKAKDYVEAITIVKNGGYATDPNYISKICSIVQRFNLNRYDPEPKTPKKVEYGVQVGSYQNKSYAKKKVSELKEHKKSSKIIFEGGRYLVISGQYKTELEAEKRVKALKKIGIESFVKEIEIES